MTTPAARTPSESGQADLLARLRDGDEQAFEQLIRDTSPRLLAVAHRYLPNDDDARDALQDAYLSAFKSLAKFDGRSQLSTWLHRILVNACLMKLRTQRRRPERSIDDLLPTFLPDGHQEHPARSWKPEPGAGIESQETRAIVRACIEQLPESYRAVLLLRDIEGFDTEQTAAMLDLTVNAAKIRLHRARQALRGLLDPHFRGGDV